MTWSALVLASVTQPQQVARHLMAWQPPLHVRWQAMILFSVLSTLMTAATVLLAGPDSQLVADGMGGPFVATVTELGINVFAVFLITGLGQLLGGQGRFGDALLLMAWLQFLLLIWQVPQSVVLLVAPPLFLPLVSVGVVLMFWLLTHFITALHGFASPLRVFFVIVGTFFLIGAAVSPFLQPLFATTGQI
jgi:Yip1 domain